MEQITSKKEEKLLSFSEISEYWELKTVYDYISNQLESDSNLLQQICNYMLKHRGKGIRPLLTVISASFGSKNKSHKINLAAAIELLHMATLLHDDIIDRSMFRRETPSVNFRWNTGAALLAGDYFYGKSIDLIQEFTSENIRYDFSHIIEHLVTGEFLQMESLYRPSLTVDQYIERISRKTAYFFSYCCSLGARFSHAPQAIIDNMEHFGYYFGLTYQIQDDIIDFLSDKDDLSQGNITLPVLIALNTSRNRSEIQEILSNKSLSKCDIDYIYRDVINSYALEHASDIYLLFKKKAKSSLGLLPSSTARSHLNEIFDLIIKQSLTEVCN